MNKNDFRSYFSGNFVDITDFTNKVLSPIFGTFNGNKAPTGNDYVKKYGDGGANISHIYDYGSFDVNGKVSVWEVVLADNCQISRARKNIQTTIRRITEDYTGAFIVFHYANGSINPEAQTWRLSWLMRTDAQVRTSPAKRYTYLCGPSYSCRTIAERFEKLQNEPRKTLGTITKAFDVEALSDEFFKEYKVMYDDIIQWITGQRIIKKNGKWKEEGTLHTGLGDIVYKKFYNAFGKDDKTATKAVRDYVKKLMGRLVFIQFLQKKGCWLKINGKTSTNFLLDVFNQVSIHYQDDFIEKVLKVVYLLLNNENRSPDSEKIDKLVLDVPFLNGGLFEPDACDDIVVQLPKEFFHNEQYQEVKREQNETRLRNNDNFFNQCGILDLFNQYNFTIDENDPNDAEVGVDPEMLGKIFENLLEDNKDKGAFYTPKEIVQYMCNESLIAYLQAKVPNHDDEIRQFVLDAEQKVVFKNEKKEKILNAIKEVKICDPAVGSGAFPVGLLNLLVALREKLEPGTNRCNLKKEIIQNNIYGVDIEKGAIDIARLRFWLSIMVDDDGSKPTPLPNFEYKFMQGNSLITTFDLQHVDIKHAKQNVTITKQINDKKKDLLKKKGDFYGLSGEEKYKKEVEIKLLIVEILKLRLGFEKDTVNQQDTTRQMVLFAAPDLPQNSRSKKKVQKIKEAQKRVRLLIEKLLEIEAKLNDETKSREERAKTDLLFFDWEICFSEIFPQGFDIVIGNPPYIDSETMVKVMPVEREIYAKRYRTARGNWDIYIPFYELGLTMLNIKGILSFITPNKWVSIGYGKKMRELYFKNFFQVCDCSSIKVFEAGNEPLICFFQSQEVNSVSLWKISYMDEFKHVADISKKKLNEDSLGMILSEELDLLIKICKARKTVADFSISQNPFTTKEAYKLCEKIRENKDCEECFKLINTGTIDPYESLWGKKTTSYLKGKYSFPIVLKDEFASVFPQRVRQTLPKLIITGMRYFEVYYDEIGEYIAGKSTIILMQDSLSKKQVLFLLGALNSTLIQFYINEAYSTLGIDGGINFSSNIVDALPIPTTISNQNNSIITLVDRIIVAKKTKPLEDTTCLECKVNVMFYILYHLTWDEVMIVENSFVYAKNGNKIDGTKKKSKKKAQTNPLSKLNINEATYTKWLERYQKDGTLPSEEEMNQMM